MGYSSLNLYSNRCVVSFTISTLGSRVLSNCRQSVDPIYRVVTTLMAVVCLWAYTTHRIRLGVAAVGVVGIIGINSILKPLFQRVRPTTEYVEGMPVHSFSLPSGHSAAHLHNPPKSPQCPRLAGRRPAQLLLGCTGWQLGMLHLQIRPPGAALIIRSTPSGIIKAQ